MKVIVAFLCIGLLGLTACPRQTRQPLETDPPMTPSAETPSPRGAGSCVAVTGGVDGVHMYLTDVTVGTHSGYDRITFEFSRGEAEGEGIPKYELSPAQPPFTYDPSDRPMEVDGDTFLHVIFHGGTGVKFEGENVEETYTGPKELKPGHPSLIEAERQSDFEATLQWMLGLSRGTCWEVTELTDPTRLVIDLPHRAE